ncbi:MAG: N-acetylmuramoyl-L-alanine amidase [Actinobacteria bacterium]|nr:N-acetylmuramoyl-L-alanine amidase [Actinomycetota bacterium]
MLDRLVRPLTVALAMAMLLVLPTVHAAGEPPSTAVSERVVPLPGDDVPVRLQVEDLVSITADLSTEHVEVRWETSDGWSDWLHFSVSGDHAPDAGTREERTFHPGISEPVWTGEVDAVELRAHEAVDVTVELVTMTGGLGYRADATPPASAEAFGVWPPIVPRTAWDPNGDCEPTSSPDVSPTAERIFVHHTAIFPDYPPEAGDDVVRAVCLGHVKNRGFSDVGYNFLIDRYGVIYQGREGGILRAVDGAHAQGFNSGSVGIALVGDFHANGVPAEAARALDTLATWLADLHDIDPLGRGHATSTGGDSTRFPEGFVVDLPNVLGHRDTGRNTACPGDHLFDIVRGERPMAPRVRNRLTHEFGWPALDETVMDPAAPPAPTTPPASPALPPSPPSSDAAELVREVVDGVGGSDVLTLVTRVLSSRGHAPVGR